MKSNIKKLVLSALLAAVTCVATLVIHIPSPLNGYINLGDCFVLLAGWFLGPAYGFLAAGIGSALADLFLGYAVYAPATFIIKGLVAALACVLFRSLGKIKNKILLYIISGIAAENLMVAGYYIFEGFMYGFVESAVNILPNGIQAAVGIVCATLLVAVINKTVVLKKYK
ncbi:MAG: ECF transporter S component [Clostridia bacterium]|nr:ECF transporter S component [Clostridia bacterium]